MPFYRLCCTSYHPQLICQSYSCSRSIISFPGCGYHASSNFVTLKVVCCTSRLYSGVIRRFRNSRARAPIFPWPSIGPLSSPTSPFSIRIFFVPSPGTGIFDGGMRLLSSYLLDVSLDCLCCLLCCTSHFPLRPGPEGKSYDFR